ncbi:hypothetical protein D779_0687 [Imhoffiella purpurea]|uniref:Uncharacterized protein n=1 Tax=Imhoffiella purpurea TaxID=1249627 RepID=W9V930_9GAMM|nr:hypothetical protein D779_0687 [Imhoffiella purpurea]
MPLVAVVPEAAPACGPQVRIQVHQIADPVEAGEEGRDLAAEIEQHLGLGLRPSVRADEDGGQLLIHLADPSMRQEAVLAKGPEQTVEMTRLLGFRAMDDQAQVLGADALGQPAGEQEAVAAAVGLEAVEVDLGHRSDDAAGGYLLM